MNHLKRKWNSLWDLKEYFLKNKEEKVEYYDGGTLRTNKGTYGLAFGELRFKANEK